MNLSLKQLYPAWFESNGKNSEVWQRELEFSKGEYIKIVAPSGSGKTSLVHFLYGVRNDYKGSILYGDKNIRDFSNEDFATLRKNSVSVVFQDLKLFPDQSVLQNLEIKRQLNPYHPPEKIPEMVDRLGIGKKLHAKAGICSYGEQQRVAIIRALLQPYDILLLDEPFSHLDTANSQLAMELMLEETKKRSASILFADLERIDYFPFTQLYHL